MIISEIEQEMGRARAAVTLIGVFIGLASFFFVQ